MHFWYYFFSIEYMYIYSYSEDWISKMNIICIKSMEGDVKYVF